MKSVSTVYGIFRTRGALEHTIDVLREEGFKSPDLSVIVGPPTRTGPPSEASSSTLLAIDRSQSGGWFAGVVQFALGSTLLQSTTAPQVAPPLGAETTQSGVHLSSFVEHGGLLLIVRVYSRTEEEVAVEVLEDGGAEYVVTAPARVDTRTRTVAPPMNVTGTNATSAG
jgi:hypothetical protein